MQSLRDVPATNRAAYKLKTLTAVASLWLVGSSTLSLADEAILRHIETVLDLTALMSAVCGQTYPDQISAKARTALNFSNEEIAAYCACSTKLVIQNMQEADFKEIEKTGAGLPLRFNEPLKQAHFACAKKVLDAKQKR